MTTLIKFIITLIITILSSSSFGLNNNKIVFTINNIAYTSIDIENRIKYLNFINLEIKELNKKEVIDDYLNLIIFNEYFKSIKKKENIDLIIKEEFENKIIKYKKTNGSDKLDNLLELIILI